ncbi:DUF4363 family protein [Ruminiclostridium papyrosolvens]|uniref:DUF4363 domain-containing protein n=1 Tax=Ruminiclostridium papyrosolvens C7 TaxID=1330534 RepID=U4R1I6_9FIRM|nr:DUF4363 family protein [Ruminiclostridium papyrosolvens]EPR10822.1 hypothetical protein L323_12100 [Ruminiclostridium papyrosolvens C7]
MSNNTKTVTVVISLVLVIIISGVLTLYYLNRSCERLEKTVNSAGLFIQSKQWDSAEKLLNDFASDWDRTKFGWAILLDHFEIDNIDNSYTKTKKYVESKDYPSALAELEALKEYIKHIPKKESFSLENIM